MVVRAVMAGRIRLHPTVVLQFAEIHQGCWNSTTVTLEKVWEYSVSGIEHFRFFSHYVSNTQRLPNGNTMINEGAGGRIIEVTTDGEIVWEYVSPFFGTEIPTRNTIYRAHRVPYAWIPQLDKPEERPVVPPDLKAFHIQPR